VIEIQDSAAESQDSAVEIQDSATESRDSMTGFQAFAAAGFINNLFN
jgi:hypothetical protein